MSARLGSEAGTRLAVPGLGATLAPAIGPTVGGYVSNAFSWYWLLWGLAPLRCSSARSNAIVFFWRAFTARQPIVDILPFRDWNFAFGCAFSFVMGVGPCGLTYLYPVYLASIRGYDALMIGEMMFVTRVAMFLMAPVSGRLSAILKKFIAAGLVVLTQLRDDGSRLSRPNNIIGGTWP